EIPDLYDPPTYRSTCRDDESSFSGDLRANERNAAIRSAKDDHCITEDMVDYVHWAINKGIDCINSIAQDPVDADLTFKKILRESKFGFYISNDNGKGLGQLTSIAMVEMAKPQHAGYRYIE